MSVSPTLVCEAFYLTSRNTVYLVPNKLGHIVNIRKRLAQTSLKQKKQAQIQANV
jgi:hypothetical protein